MLRTGPLTLPLLVSPSADTGPGAEVKSSHSSSQNPTVSVPRPLCRMKYSLRAAPFTV